MKINMDKLFKKCKNGKIRRTWRYWLVRILGSAEGNV